MMPLEAERDGEELVVRFQNCSHLHEAHISHDAASCLVCQALPRSA